MRRASKVDKAQSDNPRILITVPWPPKELSPNARVHWVNKAKAAKSYRHTCAWEAKRQGLRIMTAKPHIHITFHPPDNRRRDCDNCLAGFKAGIDGIADVIGIDDYHFGIGFGMGQPTKGGSVEIQIISQEDL